MSKLNGWTIQEIVDDPEWQELRASLVGTWKHSPAYNCMLLQKYIEKDPSDMFRYHRVKNYLTGTGFRTKAINHPRIDYLLLVVRTICDLQPLPPKEAE